MRRAAICLFVSLLTAVTAASGLVVAGSRPAAAYPSATVDIVGHGFGHGRGMGQYGALGYALGGAGYTEILQRYYSNTSLGQLSAVPGGGDPMTVEMTRFAPNANQPAGFDTIVAQESGKLTINGAAAPDKAARAVRLGPNSFRIDTAPACAGPWTAGSTVAGPVVFGTSVVDDNRSNMVQLCQPDGAVRWVRGDVLAQEGDNAARTVNRLPIESYLRGVVPRESPASWGNLGNGAGMNALRAQAVAARSYSFSENRHPTWNPPVKTCDTTTCQVYGGRAVQDASGFHDLEGCGGAAAPCRDDSGGTPDYRPSDQSIVDTAGQVRLLNGAVAHTEFSSSTGGYSAGGTFPATLDEGDATPQNPNHTWQTSVPVSTVEQAFGVGSLQSIEVLSRNNLGDMGGRVLTIKVTGSTGSQTVSGATFQSRLGLKSDWFRILAQPGGGIQGYWLLGSDGGIFSFGNASFHGSTGGMRLNKPVVGMAALPAGTGYWLVATDGGIFAFDAPFFGSTGGIVLNRPIVGMAPTPSGNGYWMVASDGGIFAFGDAQFFGSMGGRPLNKPVVGMAPTPSGKGYWMVASDGGIFAFGDATFHGSTGSLKLNRPIVAMAAGPNNSGYWLVASDGGIFAFDVPFYGSLPGAKVSEEATGMRPTRTGNGYIVSTAPGGVYSFGDAPIYGGMKQAVPNFAGRIIGLDLQPTSG
jgi:SpoIID/LytB domain protein